MRNGLRTSNSRKLADSPSWIDVWRNVDSRQTRLLRELAAAGELDMGDLIVHEVLRGFSDDLQYARARRAMLKLPMHAMVTPEVALQAAVNYRTLRAKGITVRKAVDCLIATWCIENGVALLHSDRDFDHFEQHLGLLVVR